MCLFFFHRCFVNLKEMRKIRLNVEPFLFFNFQLEVRL